MTRLRWTLPLALLLLVAGAARAQQPVPTPRDTVPRDSAAADTAGARPRAPDVLADSIIRELMRLPGYVATEYAADTAVYTSAEGVLRLHGTAEVKREGDRLNADTIVYWEKDEMVRASGSPTVSGQQAQDLSGRVLYYDLASKRASVEDARTTLSQQGTWFVRGELVSAVGNDRIYAHRAQFTTCDLEIPHYHFESDRIKVIRDKILVAVPARLYFGKVPVMVLPFVVQNLEEGRRSGLLVPRFTITDIVRQDRGYTRQIEDLGWYWAINDYLGGQVAGTWRSGAYVSLTGDLSFNWKRQFLSGNAGFTRYWQSTGSNQFAVNSSASWRPDERTNLSLSANYASSSQFIRETTIDPRETTQDMRSTLNLGRRFDWGTLQLGSDLSKSISDGGIIATLPSFSISPNTVTFFRNTNLETARWYNNASFAWNLSGRRSLSRDRLNGNNPIQDATSTELQGGITQLSFGDLSLSATGQLNQQALAELLGENPQTGAETVLPALNIDKASWNANISYRIPLVGSTQISPAVTLSQEIQRDSLTGGEYLAGPRRMTFGAGTTMALFGFVDPGFGPYSRVRHRVSTTIGYGYSPEVTQTERQQRVFGVSGGYAQNVVTLGINQTIEGKLRTPRAQPDPPQDTSLTAPDSTAIRPPSAPVDPEKVTLLSISTSSIQYDFVRAAKEGTGFVTTSISNSITSDYLRGLTIQMSHELFDRRRINPNDASQRGELGTFSPRLESLSTGFDLGPNSAIFRWIGLGNEQNEVTQGEIPGRPPTDAPTVSGTQTSTNNPRGGIGGGGDWRMSLSYAFSRPQRTFIPENAEFDDRAVQTVDGNIAFPLTPGWAMSWNTSYSITDHEFGSHRLNFRRDLHRWEANFSFYQTPTGNTAFEFFVNLIDNPDIKFDHRETNLGIDR